MQTPPSIFVIFGITGDLAQRKLLPALYHLMKDGLLPDETVILGITRRDVSAEQLMNQVELCVNEVDNICDPVGLHKVQKALRMHQMDLTDGTDYDKLLQLINKIEDEKGVCLNRLYYLSIPPAMFEPIVRNLGSHGHNQSCQHHTAATRLLVEKPFGYDLASAETLIEETGQWFQEDQIFRIDHYVAKETVQNILTIRLFNPLFNTIWNRRHIAAIDITAYEQIGIEGRAVFYEGVGALRDFVQSHLLQLLAAVTMELPDSQSSQSIHAARLKLLQQITPIQADEVADKAQRGQYEGYREEVKNPHSATETYAALTLSIDNDRWQGVPMTVRTGKAMDRKCTEIRIVFRGNQSTEDSKQGRPNELIFHIQPREGIALHLNAKQPGFSDALQTVVMEFDYQQSFANGGTADAPAHPDAYERVLVDAARGDHTLFTTSHEVLAAWRIIENVLAAWGTSDEGLKIYARGSAQIEGA